MATDGSFLKLTTKDSEEVFDVCCSTCAEHGTNREAKKYCTECLADFCESCLQDHNKFPFMRNHTITDTSGQIFEVNKHVKGVKEEIPTCSIHIGKEFMKFCKDHDEICCQACMAAKHRSCKNVVEISEASKDLKNKNYISAKKTSLIELIASLKEEKNKKINRMAQLKIEKENLLNDTSKYREELVAKINKLAKDSERVVSDKYQRMETDVQADVSILDIIIGSTTDTIRNLSSESDVKAFIYSKTCVHVIEEGQQLLKETTCTTANTEVEIAIDRNIIKSFSKLTSLHLKENDEEIEVHVHEYQASPFGQFVMGNGTCQITGVCVLNDRTIIVANFTNKTLLRLDENFKEIERLVCPSCPLGLCQTGLGEIATCLQNLQKVQFVTTDKTLMCTSNIDIGCNCFGVAYIPDSKELIVSCSSCLKIYNKETKIFLRSVQNDERGTALFSHALLSKFCSKLNLLLVADYTGNKLLALNEKMALQWIFTDTQLQNAWDVCVLPGGIILVCGTKSKCILQLDKNDQKIKTLLDSIKEPESMAYDGKNCRLIVGCNDSNVHVFNMIKK